MFVAAHGGVSIDQAALTGESLPVSKSVGDEIFSGSTCKQGEAEAIGSYKTFILTLTRRFASCSYWYRTEHIFRTSSKIGR